MLLVYIVELQSQVKNILPDRPDNQHGILNPDFHWGSGEIEKTNVFKRRMHGIRRNKVKYLFRNFLYER